MNQLVMWEMFADTYWVVIKDHKVIPVGTRFLVMEEEPNGWLLCLRDGVEPPARVLGSLLHVNQVQRLV